MKKKTMLLVLAASLLLGVAASAAEPSTSYMDSLIRAGEIPPSAARPHIAPAPKNLPPQTASVSEGKPAPEKVAPSPEKRDAPTLRYHGHGPARLPAHHRAAPDKDAPIAEKGDRPHPVFHGVGPAKLPRHHHVKPAPKEEEASLTVGINIGPDHPHHPQPYNRRHHHRR